MNMIRLPLYGALMVTVIASHAVLGGESSDVAKARAQIARAELNKLVADNNHKINLLEAQKRVTAAQINRMTDALDVVSDKDRPALVLNLNNEKVKMAKLDLDIVTTREKGAKVAADKQKQVAYLENPEVRQQHEAEARKAAAAHSQARWKSRGTKFKAAGFVATLGLSAWNAWDFHNWSGLDDLKRAWNNNIRGRNPFNWRWRSQRATTGLMAGQITRVQNNGLVRNVAQAISKVTVRGLCRASFNGVGVHYFMVKPLVNAFKK